jgi:TetR/AcrR family transcriptional regulator
VSNKAVNILNPEEEILVSAFQVFVEKGFENATMQEIAERAGIKRTVLNYYFRSKKLLYHHIAKTLMRQALPQMLKILNSDLPLELKVFSFVENYMALASKNPFLPLFIINELNSLGIDFVENLLDGEKPTIEPFLNHINAEIKQGKIIPIDPIQLFIHIISLCAFPVLAKPMIMLVTQKNDTEFKELLENRKKEVTRLILSSLQP